MTAPDITAIRARSQHPGYQEGQALQDVLALCDALDAERAENERLRMALQGMDLEAQRKTVEALLKPTLIHLVMKMSDDARAALAQKGGE